MRISLPLWLRDTRLQVIGVLLLTIFLRFGLLRGTFPALLLTILSHVGFSGYLLSRHLKRSNNRVVQFAYILACGLGITVSIGAAAQILHIPVMGYLITLFVVMYVLAWLRPRSIEDVSQPAKPTAPPMITYLSLATICGVVFVISIQMNRYRFSAIDQNVFVSLANWIANDPADLSLISRQVFTNNDPRHSVDGWTYVNGVWEWVSGVGSADIIWYDLSPIFVWTIPLIYFSIGYLLTGKATTGAFCAFVVTLFAMLTIDGIGLYSPTAFAFGRLNFFQLTVVRATSTALVLPLALLVALALFKTADWHFIIPIGLCMAVLATMHPRQALIYALSLIAIVMAVKISRLRRIPNWILFAGAGLLIVSLAPATYFFAMRNAAASPQTCPALPALIQTGAFGTTSGGYADVTLRLIALPTDVQAYVIDPTTPFFHPLLIVALLLGVGAELFTRRSFVAAYIFTTTCASLFLLIAPLIVRLAGLALRLNLPLGNVCNLSYEIDAGTIANIATAAGLLLPFGVILGVTLSAVLDYFAVTFKRNIHSFATTTAAGLLVVLLVVPMPTGTWQALNAYQRLLGPLNITQGQENLIAALKEYLYQKGLSVILAPDGIADHIIESVPNTLVAGGWARFDSVAAWVDRFYGTKEPWFDSQDIDFLNLAGINYVILRATDTRLPQFVWQPDRFEPVLTSGLYTLFRIRQPLKLSDIDHWYMAINALLLNSPSPRLNSMENSLQIDFKQSGDPKTWNAAVAAWQKLAQSQSFSPLSDYGLAISASLAGDDAQAVSVWQRLDTKHLYFVRTCLAHTLLALGRGSEAIAVLGSTLQGQDIDTTTKVLVSKLLLTKRLFYLTDSATVDLAVRTIRDNSDLWKQLSNRDDVRQESALLASIARWEDVEFWLDRLDDTELSSREMTAHGMAILAQGRIDDALTYLKPSTDPNWLALMIFRHGDRWLPNLAAQAYYMLLGNRAAREGRLEEAASAYQEALAQGAKWSARYFLWQIYLDQGKTEQGQALLKQTQDEWRAEMHSELPELIPLLTIADTHKVFVMDMDAVRNDQTNKVVVTATYGTGILWTYPVASWQIKLTDNSFDVTYDKVDIPSITVDGALTRYSTLLQIPDNLPILASAQAMAIPQFDGELNFGRVTQSLVLNPPMSATMPINAKILDESLNNGIVLKGYQASVEQGNLSLDLYWETPVKQVEDYQVFVHILDANGQIATQNDSTPVGGLYPTNQWRVGTLIKDSYSIPFSMLDQDQVYTITIGMYTLPANQRVLFTKRGKDVLILFTINRSGQMTQN